MHSQFSAQSRSHTHRRLRLEQLEPRIALSVTTAIADGSWSDPSTWNNGVPTLADDVVIANNRTVLLDGAVNNARTLLINGTLQAVENGVTNKSLVSDWILVDGGTFRVGTAANRYDTNMFTLTLEGDNPTQNLPSFGITSNDAFLMTRSGGTLDLFGSLETSWTQLGATANLGASSITLKEAVTWNAGDEIVIASTTFNMNQAETRTITSVSSDLKTVFLNVPLAFKHYGELQNYDNGKGTVYELDERAEVGLLTHSIKIQGDADSTVDGIGGNLMFMPGSGTVHIDGVEFYHMGQKSQLARYPVHWHQAGDLPNDYVKNSSIHRSFNRALTIHASHNILIEQNVASAHIGHGFFLEDAVETGNKFYYNLGLVTREPLPGEEILPTDLGPKQFQISGPSTFWITNPDNEFVGNVAAGSQNGSGFWYALPTGALGGQSGVFPQTTALGLFQGNRAHSNAIGLDVDGGPNVFTEVAESTHYSPPTDANFSDFTAFANSKNGVYFRGTSRLKLPNARLADNFQGIMFAFNQTISDSLIVGVSGNNFGGSVKQGVAVYDGPNIISNVHFAGFNEPGAGIFSVIGAANRNANHLFDQITFDDPATPFIFPDTVSNNTLSRHWGFNLYDVDGTLTGTAGQSVIFDHPMMRSDGDIVLPGWQKAAVSQRQFGHLKLNHGLSVSNQPTITFDRTEGPGSDESFTDVPQFESYTQIGVIVNTDFVYTINYDTQLLTDSFNVKISDVDSDDYVYIRVKSPWPGISASSAVAKNSEQDVRNSNQTSYFLEPTGDVFLKVFGFDSINLDEAPAPYLFADFESGIDPRASLAANPNASVGTLNFSATFGGDGVNSWQVIDNGDGINGFIDLHYSIPVPQDATGFDNLLIDTANENDTQMQIFIRDVSAGFTNLGIVQSGNASISLAGVATTSRDQVSEVLIRVFESSFSDLVSPLNSSQINLKNLAWTVAGTSSVIDIADFESGVDPNASLAATHAGLFSVLSFEADFGAEGINYWDVLDNGDGIDGFVDLHMNIGPQDWSEQGGLRINTLNELDTPVEVFIHDATEGFTPLGQIATGDQWISLSGVSAANRDEVDDLLIRVRESFFSDLNSPGNKIRVNLKHIEVTFEDPNPPVPSADFNSDGSITGSDFLAWQRGFGTPNAVITDGDADNDQDVDAADLATWESQFGGPVPLAASAAITPLEASPPAEQEASIPELAPALIESSNATKPIFWSQLVKSHFKTANIFKSASLGQFDSGSSPEELDLELRDAFTFAGSHADQLTHIYTQHDESNSLVSRPATLDEVFAQWDSDTPGNGLSPLL